MSRRKPVNILERSKLEGLHTGTLMSRRKALLACEDSFEVSDRIPGEETPEGLIEFKDTPDWKNAYTELKDELSKREHWKAPR